MGHFVMCKNNCRATLRSRGLSIGVAASGGALVELVEASLLEVEEGLHLFGVPRVGGLRHLAHRQPQQRRLRVLRVERERPRPHLEPALEPARAAELDVLLNTGSDSRLALIRDDSGSVVVDADFSALGPLSALLIRLVFKLLGSEIRLGCSGALGVGCGLQALCPVALHRQVRLHAATTMLSLESDETSQASCCLRTRYI